MSLNGQGQTNDAGHSFSFTDGKGATAKPCQMQMALVWGCETGLVVLNIMFRMTIILHLCWPHRSTSREVSDLGNLHCFCLTT
jgi:hypothetical protein